LVNPTSGLPNYPAGSNFSVQVTIPGFYYVLFGAAFERSDPSNTGGIVQLFVGGVGVPGAKVNNSNAPPQAPSEDVILSMGTLIQVVGTTVLELRGAPNGATIILDSDDPTTPLSVPLAYITLFKIAN